MEEGGRTETVEVRTCRAGPQDSAETCSAYAGGRRKGEGWAGTDVECKGTEPHTFEATAHT